MILRAREAFVSVIFREVVILAMWSLWVHRNCIIFNEGSLAFSWWHRRFVDCMKDLTLRVKQPVKDKILVFLVVSERYLVSFLGLEACKLYISLYINRKKNR